jgi:hypothetical protein
VPSASHRPRATHRGCTPAVPGKRPGNGGSHRCPDRGGRPAGRGGKLRDVRASESAGVGRKGSRGTRLTDSRRHMPLRGTGYPTSPGPAGVSLKETDDGESSDGELAGPETERQRLTCPRIRHNHPVLASTGRSQREPLREASHCIHTGEMLLSWHVRAAWVASNCRPSASQRSCDLRERRWGAARQPCCICIVAFLRAKATTVADVLRGADQSAPITTGYCSMLMSEPLRGGQH